MNFENLDTESQHFSKFYKYKQTNKCMNEEIFSPLKSMLFSWGNIVFSLTISTPRPILMFSPYPRDTFTSFSRFVYSEIAGIVEPYHCLALDLFCYEGRPTHTIKGKYLYNISITLAGVCALGWRLFSETNLTKALRWKHLISP